jgi:hypothetical protein
MDNCETVKNLLKADYPDLTQSIKNPKINRSGKSE